MTPLFGEYPVKLDAKGRFLLPAALLKLLPPAAQGEFVVNRGLDPCLVIYPQATWLAELGRIQALNPYQPENRAFARLFQAGAQPVALDSAKRLLVPKRLLEQAEIGSEAVLIGALDRIELWSEVRYDAWLAEQTPQLAALAAKVMGEKGGAV